MMTAKQALLCGAALILFGQAARAQDAQSSMTGQAAITVDLPAQTDGTPDASQSRSSGLTDIVVTARRRAESAQTVPIAVSVASAASLEQHQVVNAFQLVNLTPSLQVQSANQQVGAVNFAIRGIGTTVFGPQVESSVGIVIDDVAMSRPQFGVTQFFDIDRVEVLRGPQGMLFGKNASAGLVNISTAQPRLNETEFLANAQYGNTTAPGAGNQLTIQGAVNLPVSESSALRASGFVTRQDGFTRNITRPGDDQGITQFGGRLKYLYQPTEGVRLTFAGDYQYEEGPGESVFTRRYTAPGGLISTLDASNGVFASPTNTRLASDVPFTNDFELYGASLRAEIDLGGGYSLTNVAAYRAYKSHTSIDTDVTTANLFNTNTGGSDYSQASEELRLSSPDKNRFTYQVGLFYLHLKARQYLLQGANLGAAVPPPLSLAGGYLDGTSRTDSAAAFFEGQFRLTDAVRVTGGIRYTHDIIDLDETVTNPAALSPLYPAIDFYRKVKNNNVSYRFGVDYTLAPAVLVYATYARGYKGPTFDQLTGSPVNEEIPKSIEVGLKSTLLDRKLRLNVALFDTTFDGYQTQAQAVGTAAGYIALNAGQLKSRGVEVEATALPFEGLTISGGVTYNDTEYRNLSGVPCYYGQSTGASGTNVCLPNGTTDVSGNQLANAPRWTATATARYEHAVSADWVGFLQGDVYSRSSFNFTQTRDPNARIAANAIVGMSVGAQTANGRLSITAFVRNLFDKRVASFVLADPLAGAYTGASGRTDAAMGGNYFQNFGPNSFRTIGLSLNYRMGSPR